MINLITAILFSFSANIDNIAIGISYGIKKIHISIYKNIIIALFTSFFTFLSMYLGSYIAILLSEKVANILGPFVLLIIGFYSIISELVKKKNNNDELLVFENRQINVLSFKELATLIFMLSINNIAVGIAASVSGIHILVATISTFLFSLFLLYIGNIIGLKALNNKFIEKYSCFISSLILIIIAIIQL